MFEGLNAIPWADLTHAYGSAEETPMWLRQLASDDERVRSGALDSLYASICHQGWICPATGYAVPYLIEALQEPGIQEKDRILSLLVDIADADPLDEDDWRTNPEVPSWEVPAHIPFRDAREAVEAGLPVYHTLLDAPELRVRLWAATLLIRFSKRVQEIWPMFQAALEREPTEQGQANLVLALGNLALHLPEQRAFFLEQMQAARGELMRFATALSLTRLAQEETPEEVVQLLARALLEPSVALEAFQKLPCGGPVRKVASWTLFYLGSARLQFLAPLLEEQLRRASSKAIPDDSFDVQSLAELLVFIVFGNTPEKSRKLRPVAVLTDQQRAVLLLLLECERVWYSSNLRDLLAGHRLPETREKMAAYLGRDFPAPEAPEAVPPPPETLETMDRFTLYRASIQAVYPKLQMGMMQGSWATETEADDMVIVGARKALFRFPTQEASITKLEREITLLRALQGRLPLSIPNPEYSSQGAREIGHIFLGYAMLPGKKLYKEMLESVDGEETVQKLADQLASFLYALHHIPIAELAQIALPEALKREGWEALYKRARAELFPQMQPEKRTQLNMWFGTFLTEADIAVPLALIHGNFGPEAILYDAKARTISGVINFNRACLGDPALDFAGLLAPGSYGEDFARRFAPHYPGFAALWERAQFYATVQALEQQLRRERDRGDTAAPGQII